MRKIVVTGIGTDVGKTLLSAILVEALGADYWKPIQCGIEPSTDREQVRKLVSSSSICHSEAYCMQHPLAPHKAAHLEGIEIDESKILLPKTTRSLIIETAGGLFVPLNRHLLMIDFLSQWNCDWILISRHYVGSINHTLLTALALKARNVRVRGVIFNGQPDPDVEDSILSFSQLPCLGRILPEKTINPTIIKGYAQAWKKSLI